MAQAIHVILRRSPNHFTFWDLVLLAVAVLLKHIFAFLNYSPPLKPDSATRQAFALPRIKIEGPLKLNEYDRQRFNSAVAAKQPHLQKDDGDDLNPLFLTAMTTPLVIRILADRQCPIKPLGAVNTRNVVRFLDPAVCRDFMRLRTSAEHGKLSYVASFGGKDRPGSRQNRGVEFSIDISILHDGHTVLDQQLWFLQFLPKLAKPIFEPLAGNPLNLPPSAPKNDDIGEISMVVSDPRRWAASCKDYNPIHVSALGAKVFGFRSVIAHGNHVLALLLQQQQRSASISGNEWSAQKSLCWHSTEPFAISVQFGRPLFLPGTASVHWEPSPTLNKAANFAVLLHGKSRITGSCYELPKSH